MKEISATAKLRPAAIAQQTSTSASLLLTFFQELLAVANHLQESVGQFKVN